MDKKVDVLVIGGGLAGLMALLAAQEQSATTALVVKGKLCETGNSVIAGGGLAACFGKDGDSSRAHLEDIVKAGFFINNQEVVSSMIEVAPEAITFLNDLGVQFSKDEKGNILQYPIPGHSANRSIRTGKGGFPIINALTKAAGESDAAIIEDTVITNLLKDKNGRVIGSEGVNLLTGVSCKLYAKTIILATGGLGGYFPLTSNSLELSGDGYALALRAGADLADMEFIQFTPTALAYPEELKGVSTGGGILGQKAVRMLNSKGERFMEKYAPETMENSTRDILARAIQREIVENRGTANQGVYLDITGVKPEDIYNITGHFIIRMQKLGIDPVKEPLEIAPAMHFFMGGVKINAKGETGVPGLYAAGEVATGVHGANRLSSNGLTEAAAFGRIVGQFAAKEAVLRSEWSESIEGKSNFTYPYEQEMNQTKIITMEELKDISEKFKKIMFASGGIEREEKNILDGLQKIQALEDSIQHKKSDTIEGSVKVFEIKNKIQVGRAILKSALLRKESRGAHYRSDYPNLDNENWLKNIIVTLADDELEVTEVPVSFTYVKP